MLEVETGGGRGPLWGTEVKIGAASLSFFAAAASAILEDRALISRFSRACSFNLSNSTPFLAFDEHEIESSYSDDRLTLRLSCATNQRISVHTLVVSFQQSREVWQAPRESTTTSELGATGRYSC